MKQQGKKVVIIGPESTGKSTLARQLAALYGTSWVPEVARDYLNDLNQPYEYEDLGRIAQAQIDLEESMHREDLLICDTDLYVIMVWSEHKYGRCASWILEEIAVRNYDLYLLTDIDFPWVDDPLREHPEPFMRNYFFKLYKELLIESGKPFVVLSGSEEKRLAAADAFIRNQLS